MESQRSHLASLLLQFRMCLSGPNDRHKSWAKPVVPEREDWKGRKAALGAHGLIGQAEPAGRVSIWLIDLS